MAGGLAGCAFACSGHDTKLPDFDMQKLTPALMATLGLGRFRTLEKIKNVANQ
jgi:hypothetical protein